MAAPRALFVGGLLGPRVLHRQLHALVGRAAVRLASSSAASSKPRKANKGPVAAYDDEDDEDFQFDSAPFEREERRPGRGGARFAPGGERGERWDRGEREGRPRFAGREGTARWDGRDGGRERWGGRGEGGREGGRERWGGRGEGRGGWAGRGDREAKPWQKEDKAPTIRDEQQGTDYLYGVGPVLAALTHKRRALHKLYVKQAGEESQGGKKKDKTELFQIEELAKREGIPIEYVDKGVLNVLSDNRPHQGLVMDVGPLAFKFIKALEPVQPPPPDDAGRTRWPLWLALDQVWDPQNFGAILRTAFFLGADGVVVCSKNSAPLSPAVSKASSGAMESVVCHSANNLMKFLDESRANGWEVLGTGLGPDAVPCTEVTVEKPTVVVLGNEAYGLRTNVLNACDRLLYIGGRDRRTPEPGDVDSLNVSVAAGILLHHLLHS